MRTLAEILADLEAISDLDDDKLAEILTELQAAADERLDGDLSDDVLAELEQISEAVNGVRAEQADRETADSDRRARAEALAQSIRGEADDADDDADADADADGADDGSSDDADAGNDDADADAADDDASGDDDADADADADAADDADEEAKEPVKASAKRATPRIGRVAARRPAAVAPRQRETDREIVLTASANVPGIPAGARLDTPDKVVEAFAKTLKASAGYKGPRLELPVMRLGWDDPTEVYGDERTLGLDPRANMRKIQAITNPQAVTASGGICAPAPVRYDFPTIGTDARPVRDAMMTRFGADRGGVRLFPPVTFDDVDAGVDQWTNANDITPASPTTKPCVTMTCPEDTEEIVYAVTRCLEVGNFRARFFGEQVQEWMTKLAQWHARFAEVKLLTKIGGDSTQVTTGTVLGATRDVLAALDRAMAAYVSRHRADPSQRLRFSAPFWLQNMIRTDLAREIPGSTDERLAVADAQIAAFFAVRNVNVTWFLDGESGQVFGPQGDGTLTGWPSTVVTYLYAEGDWLFLDGGTLDLGLVRDSVLNATNDAQFFAETFEGGAFHGIETQRITMDVCPDGSTSAAVDIDPCTSGS